jgi:soluble lytic murein transglycosylase-like protein
MGIRSVITIALTGAALSSAAHGADLAMLRNGFSIRHERHEIIGSTTRLYTDADGKQFVDVPSAEVVSYEPEPATPPAEKAKSHADLGQVVQSASDRYRLDPDLVNSVIRAESGFNPHAVSRKGATGLMQLMPKTASQLGVSNAFDPAANVDGGSHYLRELLEKYDFDLVKALAAYNAGPQRVEQYGGVPPYYETRAYVARIIRDFNRKKTAQTTPAQTMAQTRKPARHATRAKAREASDRRMLAALQRPAQQ